MRARRRSSTACASCQAHRKIVVWRYYEECGVEEIAAKSERTVEARYRLLEPHPRGAE